MKQTLAIVGMNFKGLRSRVWPALVVVTGMASVVGVLLSMMSFTVGIVTACAEAGDPGRAIILSLSAQTEMQSGIARAVFPMIADADGIAKDRGKPLAEAEALVTVPMVNKATRLDSTMVLRGLGPQSIRLRPKFRLLAGRMFVAGKRELIVGRAAQGQFAGTAIGDKVLLPDGQWSIVGAFSMLGDITEGNFFADRDTMMAANRKSTYNSVLVRLSSPAGFAALKRAIAANPSLRVDIERDPDYYLRTTANTSAFLKAIANMVGATMATGAVFAALNTMYGAVASRSREIATLRALGFAGTPVVLSVVVEALALCVTGAGIGALIAWALFDGNAKAVNSSVFVLRVSPGLVMTGLIWALAVGLLGGLPPAIRAARLPIATALGAT
jgi:putative ABC transport system permease protein